MLPLLFLDSRIYRFLTSYLSLLMLQAKIKYVFSLCGLAIANIPDGISSAANKTYEGKQPFDVVPLTSDYEIWHSGIQCLLGGFAYLCGMEGLKGDSTQSILYDYNVHCTAFEIERLQDIDFAHVSSYDTIHDILASGTPKAKRKQPSVASSSKLFKVSQYRLHPACFVPPLSGASRALWISENEVLDQDLLEEVVNIEAKLTPRDAQPNEEALNEPTFKQLRILQFLIGVFAGKHMWSSGVM